MVSRLAVNQLFHVQIVVEELLVIKITNHCLMVKLVSRVALDHLFLVRTEIGQLEVIMVEKDYSYKRSSPIWKPSREKFQEIIFQMESKTDALNYFGLRNKGSNYKTLNNRIVLEKIDDSNLKIKKTKKNYDNSLIPLEKVMIENSSYARSALKKRILREKLLENKCSNCGLEPYWDNKSLIMILDHINGISNDNRLENLRFLCPNCNSQTNTFAGRKLKKATKNCEICGRHISRNKLCSSCSFKPSKNKKNKIIHKCSCGKIKQKGSKLCLSCNGKLPKFSTRKVERPSKEELNKLLWEKPTTKIAEDFGVSDSAVSKWAKSYNLEKPPRGYWGFKS